MQHYLGLPLLKIQPVWEGGDCMCVGGWGGYTKYTLALFFHQLKGLYTPNEAELFQHTHTKHRQWWVEEIQWDKKIIYAV